MRACSIDVGKVNLGVYIEEFTELNTGRGIYLRRVDLTEKKCERVTPEFLKRLFTYLDSIQEELQKCDWIIIEKQLRANPEAQFVDHALQSYFVLRGHRGITPFSSRNKTKLFDDTKMTKYQRKKWSTLKALEMLETRKDTSLLEYVKSLKKKDDVSDAICQLDAWKVLYFDKHSRTKKVSEPGEEKQAEKKPRKKKVASTNPPTEPAILAEKKPRKKKVASTVPSTEPAVVVEKKPRVKKVAEPPVQSAVVAEKKPRVKKVAEPPVQSAIIAEKKPRVKKVASTNPPTEPTVVVEKKPRKKKVASTDPSTEPAVVVEKKPRKKKVADPPVEPAALAEKLR
jgi:hypothetical protein